MSVIFIAGGERRVREANRAHTAEAGEDGLVISRKGRRWSCSGRWAGEQVSKKRAKRMKSKAQWYKVSEATRLANTCENPGS